MKMDVFTVNPAEQWRWGDDSSVPERLLLTKQKRKKRRMQRRQPAALLSRQTLVSWSRPLALPAPRFSSGSRRSKWSRAHLHLPDRRLRLQPLGDGGLFCCLCCQRRSRCWRSDGRITHRARLIYWPFCTSGKFSSCTRTCTLTNTSVVLCSLKNAGWYYFICQVQIWNHSFHHGE